MLAQTRKITTLITMRASSQSRGWLPTCIPYNVGTSTIDGFCLETKLLLSNAVYPVRLDRVAITIKYSLQSKL